MKEYNFLLKPTFFIFNLLFATWLVLKIEKISPSDFGKYNTLFDQVTVIPSTDKNSKDYLKKLCVDYKAGRFDSIVMEKKIDTCLFFFRSTK